MHVRYAGCHEGQEHNFPLLHFLPDLSASRTVDMGAHTVDKDTDDTNKPLLNKENGAASCSQEDRCGDVEYDNEVPQQISFPSIICVPKGSNVGRLMPQTNKVFYI